ncbi:MAG: PH domain-containing protein [Pseudomonadota bacterium]
MKTFKSAVDRWFYAALLSIPIAFTPALLAADDTGLRLNDVLLLLALMVICMSLPVWMLLQTQYRVSRDTLDVRCGPFRWKIARASITSAEPSRSLLSSPALSLNRVRIRYGNQQEILVSPKDRDGFIAAVLADAP